MSPKDRDHWTRRLGDFVNNDSVVVRFVALWVLCISLFFVAWTISYYLLPEGLLRRSGHPVATASAADSVWQEFLSLLAWNLGVGVLVALANTFRSIRTPMGHLVVLIMWIRGAVVWGTNSLAVPTGRLPPSLSVVLNRSGVFELTLERHRDSEWCCLRCCFLSTLSVVGWLIDTYVYGL